jgi:hypothetical protein
MSYLLAGSLNTASTFYWVQSLDDAKKGVWQDYTTVQKRIREQVENEWAAFFKDDWKVKPSLTLNLGSVTKSMHTDTCAGAIPPLSRAGSRIVWREPQRIRRLVRSLADCAGRIYLSGYGPNVSAANALQCAQARRGSRILCFPHQLRPCQE